MVSPVHDVPKASIIKVDGRNLSVRFRDGHGPCILAIHGLGLEKDLFSGIWPYVLRSPYAALIPDMLGHGDSDRQTNEPHTAEQQADLTYKAILDKSGHGVHVIGHSVGGAVALLVAERLGDRLLSYATLEGNLISSDCSEVTRETASYNEDAFRTLIFPFEHRNATKCLDVAFYRLAKSVVQLCDHGISGRFLLDILTSLPGEKLYMHGAGTNCNTDVIPMLVEREIEVVTVENAGHCFMQENAGGTYPILFDFFDRASRT